MSEHYHDSMALVLNKGAPDLFITMTVNPKDANILRQIEKECPGQETWQCPKITAKVANLQFKQLIKEVTEKMLFGTVIAYVWVIEFQKRGLPHVHLLITLSPEDKLRSAADIDRFVHLQFGVFRAFGPGNRENLVYFVSRSRASGLTDLILS